jgi:hypothetical protein
MLAVSACGGASKTAALSRANAGLATALAATNATREVFVLGDADAQTAIVAAAPTEMVGRVALTVYRTKRMAVVEAFGTVYASIALASSALALYDAGEMGAPEVIAKLHKVAEAASAVQASIAALRASP